MPVLFRLLLCLVLVAPLGAQERRRSRIWLAGQESGESVSMLTVKEGRRVVESREHLRIERQGMTITQTTTQTATRYVNGDERYTWSLRLSDLPMEGEALWKKATPRRLEVRVKGAAPRVVDIPEGALLWPEDVDRQMREAARLHRPIRIQTYAFALQQWSPLNLDPVGPDPLPGHPQALRYHGTLQQGPMELPVDAWISPAEGEIKQVASFAGIPFIVQREELPDPAAVAPGPGFFAQTLLELPPHPLLYWLDAVDLRWTGAAALKLPEDAQQRRDGKVLRLRRATPPTAPEAAESPVKGHPAAEDQPFLAPTPLVQHQDACFAMLEARLALKPGATRWEITRAVTQTVFEWIREKDMSVGFASALEVCRNAKGDCTEHGVLAVALLRRMGVPARGVLGWVGLDTTLGLHFWVEARIGGRWIPVDPTFDQAPASALRIKLGTTDLADLGSLGWDQAATAFTGGQWEPLGSWSRAVKAMGPSISGPALPTLTLPGTWTLAGGHLEGRLDGQPLRARAVLHPSPAHREGTRLFQGATSGCRGYYRAAEQLLWIALPGDRWLQVEGPDQAAALKLLEGIRIQEGS